MFKWVFLVLLLLIVVGVVAVVKTFPLPYALALLLLATIVLVVVLPWLLKRTVGRFYTRIISGAIESKSKVLRGATAHVHRITAISTPHGLEAGLTGAANASSKRYFEIDLTIHPADQQGPFHFWDPHDLVLLDAGEPLVRVEQLADLGEDEIPSYEVLQVDWPQGKPTPPPAHLIDADDLDGAPEDETGDEPEPDGDQVDKVFGQQRMLLTFAIPDDAPRELKFRYYFEDFGAVALPD